MRSTNYKKDKKIKTLDKYVIGVCIYWIVFAAVSWITFWIFGSVPDTLIQYGMGGGAVEIAATAAIQIVKQIKNVGSDDDLNEG